MLAIVCFAYFLQVLTNCFFGIKKKNELLNFFFALSEDKHCVYLSCPIDFYLSHRSSQEQIIQL